MEEYFSSNEMYLSLQTRPFNFEMNHRPAAATLSAPTDLPQLIESHMLAHMQPECVVV